MRTWQVGDVMTMDVVAVSESSTYRHIIDVVTTQHISAVPVVDDFRYVRGVVSEADLLHKVELIGEPRERRVFEGRRRRRERIKAEAAVARDLMTSPAVTTYASTPLVAAAKLMHAEHVKRLPVIDDLGRLVGIVTRGDLLKVHLRPDMDIRCDVGEEVLRKVLAVRDGTVRVVVHDGIVELSGTMTLRSAAELAAKLAAQVSGVVEVVNKIVFEEDDTLFTELTSTGAVPVGVS